MKRTTCIAIAAGAFANAASAHHGITNFDLNTDIALEGVVTNVEFINPHSWLNLDVTGVDGEVTAWRCELRGATVLRRSGWTPEMFPDGLQIRITGSPDRRDPTTCYLGTAFFPDGSSIDRYGQLREAAPEKRAARPLRLADGQLNLAGDWASEQRVMTDPRGQSGTLVPVSVADRFEPGGFPEGGAAFPGARGTAISLADDPVDAFWNQRPSAFQLTETGAAAIEGWDWSSTANPRLACEPTNILFDWTFEADINQISQSETEIRMLYGSMGIERVIHLDMTEHPADLRPSLAGHSIGRWEGDVLVVDTVGFVPGVLSADSRLPHSEQLHVTERFELNAETMSLGRTYTAEDPRYFEGQFRGGDAVLPSDLPFHGTTECDDRTYRDLAAQDTDSAPWWMFWENWF